MPINRRVAVIRQFGRTYRLFLSAFESEVGLPLVRWALLLALYQRDTPASQKVLAEQLRIDPGALTRHLKAMEGLGWVERHTDTRDNRVTNVQLSANGREVVLRALPQRDAFIDRTVSVLPDEAVDALSAALEMLEGQLQQRAAAPRVTA